ncbi:MAG TPA: hypothetical protein VIU02_11915 [Burkholderiales bacterium]
MNLLKLAVVIALASTASTGLAENHGERPSMAEFAQGSAQRAGREFESDPKGILSNRRAREALPFLWMPARRTHDMRCAGMANLS